MQYLYFGLSGKTRLVPWMWTSVIFALISLTLLLIPKTRKNHKILFVTCLMVFVSIWLEKGLGLIITGFIPDPLGKIVQYWPTIPETLISLGIWAFGFFLITIFYKIALSVRKEIEI
jgi:molybdopterin-containing oxidoreductase family membrane subunit